MLDWMGYTLLTQKSNISKFVDFYDKLDEETKSTKIDEVNDRIEEILQAIEWVWRTMREGSISLNRWNKYFR